MELNTSGFYKKIRDMNPCPEMLTEMRQRDIPVVIGSDSHVPERVGDRFLAACDVLSAAGYNQVENPASLTTLSPNPITNHEFALVRSLLPDHRRVFPAAYTADDGNLCTGRCEQRCNSR